MIQRIRHITHVWGLELCLAVAVLSLIAQLAWPSVHSWWNRPLPGKQVAVSSDIYPYLIYLPEDYSAYSTRRWPLLLHLHGAGERGTELLKVRRCSIPRFIDEDHQLAMIVVSPQCPASVGWNSTQLMALLDDLETKYRIGPILVTGYSMGGYGTWDLATTVPEKFTAIAPICGGGDTSKAAALAEMPVWAFHGEMDDVVPIESSRAMVEAVNAAGGSAKLTVYPNGGHDVWDIPYHDPAFYEWLLSEAL